MIVLEHYWAAYLAGGCAGILVGLAVIWISNR